MKRECPQCGFELRTMSWYEKFVREKLDRYEGQVLDDTFCGFDLWMELRPGSSRQVTDLGEVTLVEAKVDYSFDHAENMVYVVLRVGPEDGGDHYIQHGYRDSYGGATWDPDGFRAVSKQTRTTWIWEENA